EPDQRFGHDLDHTTDVARNSWPVGRPQVSPSCESNPKHWLLIQQPVRQYLIEGPDLFVVHRGPLALAQVLALAKLKSCRPAVWSMLESANYRSLLSY